MDCGDHLRVRKGRIVEIVRFENIKDVGVSTNALNRIVIRVAKSIKLDRQIEFLPEATVQNALEFVGIAEGLKARANEVRLKPPIAVNSG
jgi:hypothetical protein